MRDFDLKYGVHESPFRARRHARPRLRTDFHRGGFGDVKICVDNFMKKNTMSFTIIKTDGEQRIEFAWMEDPPHVSACAA